MSDGLPFETEQMHTRRAKQRRRLLGIEEWFVSPTLHRLPLSPPVDRGDAGLVEEQLRDEADALTNELAEFLVEMEAGLKGRVLSTYLKNAYADLGGKWLERTPPLSRLNEQAIEAAKSAPNDLSSAGDLGPKLADLVIALIWADAVASDGYEDPRVTTIREKRVERERMEQAG